MYNMCLSSKIESLVSKVRDLSFRVAMDLVFILATVFNIEVVQTKTSFLAILVMHNYLRNSSFNYSSSRLTSSDCNVVNCNFFCRTWY